MDVTSGAWSYFREKTEITESGKDETYMLKLGKANTEKRVDEESLCGEWLTTEEEYGRPVPDWPFERPTGTGTPLPISHYGCTRGSDPLLVSKGGSHLLLRDVKGAWARQDETIRMRCQWEALPRRPRATPAHMEGVESELTPPAGATSFADHVPSITPNPLPPPKASIGLGGPSEPRRIAPVAPAASRSASRRLPTSVSWPDPTSNRPRRLRDGEEVEDGLTRCKDGEHEGRRRVETNLTRLRDSSSTPLRMPLEGQTSLHSDGRRLARSSQILLRPFRCDIHHPRLFRAKNVRTRSPGPHLFRAEVVLARFRRDLFKNDPTRGRSLPDGPDLGNQVHRVPRSMLIAGKRDGSEDVLLPLRTPGRDVRGEDEGPSRAPRIQAQGRAPTPVLAPALTPAPAPAPTPAPELIPGARASTIACRATMPRGRTRGHRRARRSSSREELTTRLHSRSLTGREAPRLLERMTGETLPQSGQSLMERFGGENIASSSRPLLDRFDDVVDVEMPMASVYQRFNVPLEERIGEEKKHRFRKHNRAQKHERKETERRAKEDEERRE
ncbi:hypothetical protein B0H14DRAFT_2599758 [Mycena olivaceomarginata]|nr:hypothetical protein B0H14DRAFT_2599758 [Mycena olivaceomarginata]